MAGGLRGRRAQPTALKIVRGNPGHRALPKDEPAPPEIDPPKPKHVHQDAVASEEWDRLLDLTTMKGCRVLTVADGPMLEATVMAYSLYRAALETMRSEGTTFETTNSAGAIVIKIRPEVQIEKDAWRRYVNGLTHFGLSPATRSKVKTIEGGRDALGEFGG